MRLVFLCAVPFLLAACAQPPTEVAERRSSASDAGLLAVDMPPMKRFSGQRARAPEQANADIARDFLALAFRMESGREIARLSRFEGPVRVAVAAGTPALLQHELDRLLGRLRDEAQIDIDRAAPGETAQILIETPSSAEVARAVPGAACFVVPRVFGWNDFLRNRRGSALDWTTLATRERATVLIPHDVSPQEMRDCLHEELAQALGPLNDLYELPDSVFNDDNIHGALTGFDMLVLRAFNAPELRSGMSRAEVAAALPAVLARINPRGERRGSGTRQPTPRAWIDMVERAMGQSGSRARRRAAAKAALEMAERAGWQDNRLGFALYAEGRLMLDDDPGAALRAFRRAHDIYRARYGENSIHAAHLALQIAAYELSRGAVEPALAVLKPSIPAAKAAENAALLATLLMMKAEALELAGQPRAAETVRLDSLAWAQYGFGSIETVRERLAEVAALSPRRERAGN